jgi:ribosome maturation factor RimP
MRGVPEVEGDLPSRVEALGFEVVRVEWAGNKRRPILRIRIDRPEAADGEGVTVDDCAVVSRGLEPWLDALESVPDGYVLEVSSPGVDRPLTRDRDWERFTGRQVAVKGPEPLAGRATYLEGELGGLSEEGGRRTVLLRLAGGDELRIPREEITEARLVFRWK